MPSPSPGRRSAARACRRRPRSARPCARASGRRSGRRSSSARPPWRSLEPVGAGVRLRARASRRSPPARASIEKCTMISEPSASRSSTSPVQAAVAGRVGRERGVLEVLRPDAEDDASGRRSPSAPGAPTSVSSPSAMRSLPATAREARRRALERRLEHVHRRAADEAADEEVDRAGRRAPAARRPAAARPCASRRRGRPSSSPRSGRA